MRRILAATLVAVPAAGLAQYEGAPEYAVEGEPAYDVGIPAKSEPRVFFLNLMDGETVSSPVFVEFGMVGATVWPAGEEMIEGAMTAHHHLLINRDVNSITPGEPMPAEPDLIHFGDGGTFTTLDLPPGAHTLQLVAADDNHVPLDPMVASQVLTITVAE